MTIELYVINKKLIAFFSRYHMVTFAFLACIFLAIVVYLLFMIIDSTTVAPTDASSTITGFDQQTVDKIKELRDSNSGSAEFHIPPGSRQSPFSE